jgi:hypothetical protein
VSQYAKREPYPFSIKIDGVGFMLGSPGPNQPAMVSAKAQDISAVSPPDYAYSGLNPLSEREQPYESLALGMGLKVQQEWQDQRYAYAQGVDASVWPWCRGPQVNPSAGGGGGAVVDFFELGGNLFVAAGTQIFRYTPATNSWAATANFGAPIVCVDVFASNFDGIPLVWVGLQGAVAHYSADATTFTAMPTFRALAFARIGREWWWADDINRLRKLDTDADPRLEANYTSLQFRAGDRSSPITSLMVTSRGQLIIAKTDGMYTLLADGDEQVLYPFLQYAPVADNGKPWGTFLDDLYVAYGPNFSRIGPDLALEQVGPEKLVMNDAPVRGMITAFAGVGTLFAYAAIWNPDLGTSYLLKYSGYVTRREGVEAERIDAWHGSLNDGWPGVYPTKLWVSAVGAPAGHSRTYIGLSNGLVQWVVNPCVPNPPSCTSYRFEVGSGFVEMPLWHGGYHASRKSVRHILILSTFINPSNYVTVQYTVTPTGPLLDIPTVFDQSPFEQADMPPDTVVVLSRFRVHLHNTGNTFSPLVSAFSIGHALRPRRVMQFEADILCADGIVRRDGVTMRMGRQAIRAWIEKAIDDPGAVRCILPDEQVQDLSFTDYQISQSFDEVGRQWRGSLRVRGVQWTSAQGVTV